jgi:arabinofuranosyltransferase
MMGRFLAVPCFLSALYISRQNLNFNVATPVLVLLGLVALQSKASPLAYFSQAFPSDPNSKIDVRGVADERGFYSHISLEAFHREYKSVPSPNATFATSLANSKRKVLLHGNMGVLGFYANSDVHIVDIYGLTDPLLARLPAQKEDWRIGHFERVVPKGYVLSLKHRRNLIQNRSLHKFYSILTNITQGSVWSLKRFKNIIGINLGFYDYLLEDYSKQAT